MQVQADVDQSDIGQMKVGEPVMFTVDAYPDQPFRGQISQVRLNATVTQNVITYPVIVEVPNPDLKLRPSMTANVTIRVATVRDVLRVPNAALRFRPATEEGKPAAGGAAAGGAQAGGRNGGAAGPGGAGSGGPGSGGPRGGGQWSGSGRGGGGRRQQGQTVYVLDPAAADKKAQLRPVQIRTGITDGHYTQVVSVISGTLNPGDTVVTGLATLKVDPSAAGANRGPGGPGRGLGRF
jgi:HlyD family secretion protein